MITFMMLKQVDPWHALGYIPGFLSEDDPRPAKQQIDERYISGWNRFDGFKMAGNFSLRYPGDPALEPLAMTHLRDETIYVYRYGWVAIVQPDKSFEVARLD